MIAPGAGDDELLGQPVGRWPPALLEETFEAVLVDWPLVGAVDSRRRLDLLRAAGVHVIVVGGPGAARLSSADSGRVGAGRLVVCEEQGSEVFEMAERGVERLLPSGRRVPSAIDAVAPPGTLIGEWLGGLGLAGRLVMVASWSCRPGESVASDWARSERWLERAVVVCFGEGHGAGSDGVVHRRGVREFWDVLDRQLARRAARRVPQVDPDPEWVVCLDGHEPRAGVEESLGALANGWIGARASLEEGSPDTSPLTAVAGAYTADNLLLEGPLWTVLETTAGGPYQRLLDLRTGVLARVSGERGGLRSARFVSAADPAAMASRAESTGVSPEPTDILRPPDQVAGWETLRREGIDLAKTGLPGETQIFVASRDRTTRERGRWSLERLAALATARDSDGYDEAFERLRELDQAGFDALLARHRKAWADLWAGASVSIEGSPRDQLDARFAIFHLLGAASDEGEAVVGARGLTGTAYGGHVFWDADVFVLPALAAVRPRAARAMLEYRIRRLPAARAAAKARGREGARFPWESAADGSDVTPVSVRGRRGELIPIATGRHEVHIVADVAWAALRYAEWSGDRGLVTDGPGRDLVVDTARYWLSRARIDRTGRAHLYGVMGPDEYHEVVDDNAYTNVMARWNLRRAAGLLSAARQDEEAGRMRSVADSLVDGWDSGKGIYEQFAGYYALEPLRVGDVASPPVAIDVLLGPERVAGSQLIKQADVLMLHHMVPEEAEDGSLAACLDFYGPRTAHGSSLSPAIHASLMARAGRPRDALQMFRLAARLDLDDLTGTTGQGLHLATMGGLWQALAYGFLGLSVDGGILSVDPRLPEEWAALDLRFHLAGHLVGVRAEHDVIRIACEAPLTVRLRDGRRFLCEPPGTTIRPRADC